MEVFKFILTNYGPAVAACCLMVYLCFFTKKSISGDEKKLKNDLAQVLRENAELKVQLNKAMDKVKSTDVVKKIAFFQIYKIIIS